MSYKSNKDFKKTKLKSIQELIYESKKFVKEHNPPNKTIKYDLKG